MEWEILLFSVTNILGKQNISVNFNSGNRGPDKNGTQIPWVRVL